MWYGLMTGTIEPAHLLGPDEYARAAQALIRRVGGLAWQFLGGTAIGRVLVILTLALAIVLLRFSATGHIGGVIGTAVLLLSALGVTAGSAVSAVGRVLRQAQAPLWEAELTHSIARAAVVLPE